MVRLIDAEKTSGKLKVKAGKAGGRLALPRAEAFFADFQRLSIIHAYMDSLVASYPKLASIASIGRSFEGRDMKIIKIGAGGTTGVKNTGKPILWIDAGIHAREWAAPPVALYIAYSLLSNYETDAETKRLVDTFEWHILPSANPDGYEFSHEGVSIFTFVNLLLICQKQMSLIVMHL